MAKETAQIIDLEEARRRRAAARTTPVPSPCSFMPMVMMVPVWFVPAFYHAAAAR